jgi:hypothetical protein
MELLRAIGDFLNNQSVAAFMGAFAAFALVVLNDWRRDARKVKNIAGEIAMNRSLAEGKLEAVRSNRNLMRQHNKVMPAPILKFNTTLIRELYAEVLSRLRVEQRRAIEALCYTMEATDGVLLEAHELARSFGSSEPADRIAKAERLLTEYADAIVNLKRLMEMCDNYVMGNYTVIVTKQYDRPPCLRGAMTVSNNTPHADARERARHTHAAGRWA